MTTKTCFKCGESKPRSEFYRHPQMADGLLGKCKECAKRDVTLNRDAKADYYNRVDRERAKEPERRASLLETGARMRRKYPEKFAARSELNAAVRRGLITKPASCEDCGRKARVEGHHPDYSKPLEVEWLCVACHKRRHRRIER